jgi:meiotically up-regulated gene 157 (Mug157) protein
MRPDASCRTFNSSAVEDLVKKMESTIADPDLYRLFLNSYPNTLDTAIKWRGVAANNSDEELTFVITGDINAMWLRDSANQMQSYLPVLTADPSRDSIASLFRGVINLHTRYILTSPYCNSFQAPAESGIAPAQNGAATGDSVTPSYSTDSVFECKYELDSLAAFLEVSADYYKGTGDLDFFAKFQWLPTVRAILNVAYAMQTPTYGSDGRVLDSPYRFTRQTTRATETFANDGLGNPVANGTGLIRSGFRPSDDSTIFQLFIPGNMMFARYLEATSDIVAKLGNRAPAGLAAEMRQLASSLRDAIDNYGTVSPAATPSAGRRNKRQWSGFDDSVYAFEVDGFGSSIIMDDANIPSLLSAPFFGYVNVNDPTYQRTRRLILDSRNQNGNSYFMRGPVINAVGGPHVGVGMAWPMGNIVRILTSSDDNEIITALKEILSTTDGLGLIHESVNTFNSKTWTRQW